MNEKWLPISGFNNFYEVNTVGEVKSVDRLVLSNRRDNCSIFKKGRILNQEQSKCGYNRVKLSIDGYSKFYSVHRLVAEAFIPNPLNFPQVNHINGIKTDNRVENLEWCNNSYNHKHAFLLGIRIAMIGENNPTSKLNWEKVREIREIYKSKNYTQRQLAAKYFVTQTTIKDILKQKTWKENIS